jgi:hypothetical protein
LGNTGFSAWPCCCWPPLIKESSFFLSFNQSLCPTAKKSLPSFLNMDSELRIHRPTVGIEKRHFSRSRSISNPKRCWQTGRSLAWTSDNAIRFMWSGMSSRLDLFIDLPGRIARLRVLAAIQAPCLAAYRWIDQKWICWKE